MGMIESVEIVSRNVVVSLRMTSPLCHALPYFQMEVERVLAGITGVDGVKCTFDYGGELEPHNINPPAKPKTSDHRRCVPNPAGKSAPKNIPSTLYPTKRPFNYEQTPSTHPINPPPS